MLCWLEFTLWFILFCWSRFRSLCCCSDSKTIESWMVVYFELVLPLPWVRTCLSFGRNTTNENLKEINYWVILFHKYLVTITSMKFSLKTTISKNKCTFFFLSIFISSNYSRNLGCYIFNNNHSSIHDL